MDRSYRILVADKLAKQGLDVLDQAGRLADIYWEQQIGKTPEELAKIVGDFDALIIRSATKVTAEVIAAADRLRVIGRAGIGVDNVDVPAATRKGIVVMNVPGGNAITTAEHAISMMLSLSRLIPQATASMKAGKWEKSVFTGSEIYNKTLGIVGIGNIGSLVADRARGLHMKVIAYDPFLSEERARQLGVELVEFNDLCASADFITIHTPKSPDTQYLINAEAIARMKPTARLINCARGGIVDEKALADALREGRLAGAALDVYEKEPPPSDNPLLSLDNVVLTPHLGAATKEAQLNVAVGIAEQIVHFLLTGEARNALNFPFISEELREALGPYLILGEKLGSLQAQLLDEAPKEIEISYIGEISTVDVRSVTAAILRGLLNRLMDTGSVNYVNAGPIARERGIKIVESKTTKTKGYQNMVNVRIQTASGESEVGGAVFGKDIVRLVKIDHFYLEAVPEGNILLLHNKDVPGVVGAVGTVLGEEKVNIAGLQLGREAAGAVAISLIHVDEPVSDNALKRLRAHPSIVSADLLQL